MNSLPPILNKVIESFKKFPGIGGKTAHRLGLHALKSNAKDIEEFAQSLLDLKNNISTCSVCFNFSESDLCEIFDCVLYNDEELEEEHDNAESTVKNRVAKVGYISKG